MKPEEFHEGWALLLAQPYAREYVLDPSRELVQRTTYRSKLLRYSGAAWMRTVDGWLMRERHWPLLPDVLDLVRTEERRIKRAETQRQAVTALADTPHIPLSMREITAFAREHGLSMLEAIRRWEDVVASVQATTHT